MSTPGNRRGLERFGGLNDIRSNFYRERTLDLRNGMGSISTINFKNTLETGYARDSLSSFGNTFRARVLGVATGAPSRRRYPEIFNSTIAQDNNGKVVEDYFLFFLRMEFDSFTPDPDLYCNTVEQYTNLSSLQGRAISRVPASEFEPVGPGDIVEVYLPNQNSYDGALVNKVVIRNSADPFVPPGGGFVSQAFNAVNGAYGQYNSAAVGGNFSFSSTPSAGGITNTVTAEQARRSPRGVLTTISDEGVLQHIKERRGESTFPGSATMEIISLTSKTPPSFVSRENTGGTTYVGAVRTSGANFRQHKGIDLFLGSRTMLYLPTNMNLVSIGNRVYGSNPGAQMDYGISMTFKTRIGEMEVEFVFREMKLDENNPSAQLTLSKSIGAFRSKFTPGIAEGETSLDSAIEFAAGEPFALTYFADPNRLRGSDFRRQFGGGTDGAGSRDGDSTTRIAENKFPGGDYAMLHLETRINRVLTNAPAVFNLECLIDPNKPANFATEEDLRAILAANSTGTNLAAVAAAASSGPIVASAPTVASVPTATGTYPAEDAGFSVEI